MDFIFEFVFQILFEILGEALFEFGFKGAAAVMRSRVGRYATMAIAGFIFGVLWGTNLAGGDHRPRLFWVSIAMAVIAGLGALYRRQRPVAEHRGLGYLVAPTTWPAWRWLGFVVLTVAVALGIATGWTPVAK